MNTCRKSISLTKQSGLSGSLYSHWRYILKEHLLDKLLFLIKPAAEYALGMHIGFLLGWITGFCIGHYYVEYFKPVYIEDFSELSYWNIAPGMFARYGALTGLAIGVIVIAIINNKLLHQRIISFYENKNTNPTEIARTLCKRTLRIDRITNTLVKKGRISQKEFARQSRSSPFL